MRCKFNWSVLTAGFLLLLTSLCFADGSGAAAQEIKAGDELSGSAGKSENYLPGEEIVTPAGKKMRVWSTKGPVPVSRAPEPFEDREKTVLPNAGIVVDTRTTDIYQQRSREKGGVNETLPHDGGVQITPDSFEVPPMHKGGRK